MVSRKCLVVAAVLLGALMCVATVHAQGRQPGGRGQGGPGGRGFGGPGGFGGGFRTSVTQTVVRLARTLPDNEKLQKEVDVLPEQVADLKKYFDAQQENRPRPEFPQNFREMSEEDRQKFFEDMRKQGEKREKETLAKINEYLLPHQTDRLHEIALQLMGLTALQDSEVAGKLKISEDQKSKMETVQQELGEQMRERMREAFQGGDRDAIRKQMEEFAKERETKVLAVLTSAQKADFEKMKGKPVEMTDEERGALRGGFGGRGFGGPGGGPGGGRGFGGGRPGGGRPGGNDRPARPGSDNQ